MSRRNILVPLGLLALLLSPVAPAAAQDAGSIAANQEVRIQQLEGQIRDLNGQIEQLNYRVQQLSERLDKLVADVDYRLRQVEGGGASMTAEPAPAGPAAAPLAQTAAPAATESAGGSSAPPSAAGASSAPGVGKPKILGTMTQSQYDAQSKMLNQNADAAAAAAAAGAAPAQTAGVAPTQPAGDQTAAAAESYTLPGATPDEQYQYAFDLLRQTKYAEAEKALHAFVDQYPDHPLAGNASYWLGETFYAQQDYNNAALTFAEGIQKYPKSGKAPDTLLKLGMSLAALGETADACKAFQELDARFPTASDSIKQRAAKEQSKNGCQ